MPPRHIFSIVMESYNGWPLLEPYRALGITRKMERLGRSGLLFEHFLPAGTGTMDSLGPLLAGLAEPGIPINYQVNSADPTRPALRRSFAGSATARASSTPGT